MDINETSGTVFNIQRFSLHDGPGIRTTVFLKGCTLKCIWCHNPESICRTPQLQTFFQKCIGCGKCIDACKYGATGKSEDGSMYFLREKCVSCGKCAETCYAEARVMTGKPMTVTEVVTEVMKDELFYKNSGGGVTLSGGEPLMQADFTAAVLERCKANNLHTAVDTAGNIRWDAFEKVLPYTDLFLFDLKAVDSDLHKKATGHGNELILENIKKLADGSKKIWIRIPVIPGINDDPAEISKTAAFVKDLKGVEFTELLPFHKLGSGKYESLGMEFEALAIEPPSDERMETLMNIFRAQGLEVKRG